ncbi:MAG: hypothetical protein DELT_00667 [Desulfovibrio sp.]
MKKQSAYGGFWAIPIALLLVPFIYAAFFTFPQGDDFAPAVRAKHLFDIIGGFDHMFSAWWKWSGRYSFSFLWVFLGDVAEYRATYTASILLSFCILWVSVFGIARELGKDTAKGQAAFIATFWLFAVLCSHGTVRQWYFLVELETLLAGYSFTLVYIWSLCRLWNRDTVTRSVKWFPIISCILAAGFYEHSAPLVLAISVGAWLLATMYNHPSRKVYFLLVKISTVCFLIMYLARGNFRRQDKRGMTFALMFEQVCNAGKDWWKYILPAYCNPIYLAALFVAVWMPPRAKTPLTEKIPAPLILGGSLVLFCGFSFALTIMHALSDVTVGEASKIPANIAQYSIVFVFFALYACRDWLRLHVLQALGRPVSLVFVLGVLVVGNSNFFPALWNGAFGEIGRYGEAYEKRQAVMAQNGGQELTVMPLSSAPLPLPNDTITTGVKSWPNKYAAPFYGLRGLDVAMPTATDAYAVAALEDKLKWLDIGPGIKMAHAPSLSLVDGNESYRFDWVFIENDSAENTHIRVAVFGGCKLAQAVASSSKAMATIARGAWPFQGVFAAYGSLPLEVEGRKYFAVPLPLLDSEESARVRNMQISVDGQPFISVLKK